MLERTKKPRIDSVGNGIVELCVTVRAKDMEAARSAIAPFLAEDASVHWRTVYPDFGPAQGLKGARSKEGLTQRELSELANIPQRHISEMENGKRPIGKAMAKRFAQVLNVDYRVML